MVIIVEGKTDKTFVELVLTYLDIKFNDNNFIVMKNKSNLLNPQHSKYISLKESIKVGKISSNLLFILDADYEASGSGYLKSDEAINNTIKELDFVDFSEYLIMCNPQSKQGYLESLILTAIAEEENKCIKKVLECAEIEKQHDKDIFNKIYRYYYPNSAINLEHKNFKPLIDKLKKLFNKEA